MKRPVRIKQHDITDCGAACLASIAEYHNSKIPISRIRQLAETDKKGTNVLGLIKAAEKIGFSAKGVKGPIEALISIPTPAVAHVIVKKVLYHYVVIYKVTKDQVIVMDPGDGKIHRYSYSAWQKIWTGVLVLFAPAESFLERNERVGVWKRLLHLLVPHRSIFIQAMVGAIIYTILGLSTSTIVREGNIS